VRPGVVGPGATAAPRPGAPTSMRKIGASPPPLVGVAVVGGGSVLGGVGAVATRRGGVAVRARVGVGVTGVGGAAMGGGGAVGSGGGGGGGRSCETSMSTSDTRGGGGRGGSFDTTPTASTTTASIRCTAIVAATVRWRVDAIGYFGAGVTVVGAAAGSLASEIDSMPAVLASSIAP
jgi:hypothetical protein